MDASLFDVTRVPALFGLHPCPRRPAQVRGHRARITQRLGDAATHGGRIGLTRMAVRVDVRGEIRCRVHK
jgi:hypothetical protein